MRCNAREVGRAAAGGASNPPAFVEIELPGDGVELLVPDTHTDTTEQAAATSAGTSGSGGGLVSRLAAAVRQRLQKRNVQEEIDTCHVYMLTGMREQQQQQSQSSSLRSPHAPNVTAAATPKPQTIPSPEVHLATLS